MELRKVKCYPAMSEETECFSAELWVDGKLTAYLKNNGRGGNNTIHPAEGFTYKDVSQYDSLDNEAKIFEMVIEFDEIRKNQSKGFYMKKGEDYYIQKFPMPISKLKKNFEYAGWLAKKLDQIKKDGFTVLNKNL